MPCCRWTEIEVRRDSARAQMRFKRNLATTLRLCIIAAMVVLLQEDEGDCL